jgi:hypothetical protein
MEIKGKLEIVRQREKIGMGLYLRAIPKVKQSIDFFYWLNDKRQKFKERLK